jgi:cyclopropane-fatty-acyl-phospholipid synthase
MTYSCAIFKDLDGDLQRGMIGLDGEELQEAQVRKLNHIIRKARIFPGHRVLEIGSGWGSLAIRIASTIDDTTVDTLTLSTQQRELAMQRVKAAGLENRITVHLMDYRNMPTEWKGAFDRVVSVEMMEAIGAEFLERYWNAVDWAMKSQDSAGVVQVITLPEPRRLWLPVFAFSWLTNPNRTCNLH